MDQRASVLVIMGSIRAGRVCTVIAAWIAQLGLEFTSLRYEIVDLLDWPLPMHDEPAIPATGYYSQAHTRAWSGKINTAAAIIFVSPQYNAGYPAALKNAIDHLHQEWRDKPALIVTYGGRGGTKCAEQLRQVAGAVKLRLVPESPALVLPGGVIRDGVTLVPARDFTAHVTSLKSAFDQLAGMLSAPGPPSISSP